MKRIAILLICFACLLSALYLLNEKNRENIVEFQGDNFTIGIDTELWIENQFDSGIYSWKSQNDADTFLEIGHMAKQPGVDKVVEMTEKRNGCSTHDQITLPEDSPYNFAVSMTKDNSYLLELYFTPSLNDGTYYLVICCYDPSNEVLRDISHTAVFSFTKQ